MTNRLGHYILTRFPLNGGWEEVRAYLPAPLPPDPPVSVSHFVHLLEDARAALGKLDGLAAFLPDPDTLLYSFVRKEAVVSSQIEGTQSSLSDLLVFESEDAPGAPVDSDVSEVSNYVNALLHGQQRLADLPLSLRLIREVHARLMTGVRGGDRQPGEFRTSQNWIGGTRPGNAVFVPPPPADLMKCLDAFEKFLHVENRELPVLIKTAMAHVQFETIHPFLDGNGRVGRLLITLMLLANGLTERPLLYLSLYLKRNRERYYELLQKVRVDGDWEAWIEFFLIGVAESATRSVETAKRLLAVFERDGKRIEAIGRLASSALHAHRYFQGRPILSIGAVTRALGVSFHAAKRAIGELERLGVVREITGKQRDRFFAYGEYLDILSEGTEPLPR
ncbi:MAG: Fic family protein [Bryobacteraceae bacterium]|nr:Fic family protein [Bryobacteraceae bacterium]